MLVLPQMCSLGMSAHSHCFIFCVEAFQFLGISLSGPGVISGDQSSLCMCIFRCLLCLFLWPFQGFTSDVKIWSTSMGKFEYFIFYSVRTSVWAWACAVKFLHEMDRRGHHIPWSWRKLWAASCGAVSMTHVLWDWAVSPASNKTFLRANPWGQN